MRIKGAAKLVSVNLLVLVGLFAGVNLLSLVVVEGYLLAKRVVRGAPSVEGQWWNLPVYTDKERSRALYEDHLKLTSRYVPFTAWSRFPFEGVGTTINEVGDRVHVPPEWNGEKTTVVRFFGGSTMWGAGADDQGTIAAIYNDLNPQFTVHNHGESGHNSRQSLDRMITLLSKGDPMDVAIFYEGVNEVFNCMAGEDSPTHSQVTRLRTVAAPQDDFYDHLWGVTRTLLLSRTAVLASGVWKRMPLGAGGGPVVIKRWDCDDDPEKATAAAEILLRNWEVARAIAEARGVHLIAVLQPHAHVSSPETDHVLPFLRADMAAVYGVLYPAIQKVLGEVDHDWIYDMTDGFDGIGPVLIDDFHVTETGNRAIAERIHTVLSLDGG